METVQHLLRKRQLRQTQSRTDILTVLWQREEALSEREIEAALPNSCDRVTIYRTLSTFLSKGLIHKVLDNTGSMKYALCPDACQSDGAHRHDHVHFKCVQCGRTRCLEDIPVPGVPLPQGYQLQAVNMLLEGICPACASSEG